MRISPQFITEIKNERLRSEAYQISELLINDVGRQSPAWWDSSFDKCMNITITNAGSTALINFPAYINLTHNSNMLLSNYQDLRFVNTYCNNRGSALDYEIENYTANNAHIWVRIPTLSTGNNVISVYYKNNTPVGSGQNAAGVWDSNYNMVQHLEEFSGNFIDSTSNGKNAVMWGVTYNANGSIDGAASFDGGWSYAYVTNIAVGGSFTYELWMKYSGQSTTSQWPYLLGSYSSHVYPSIRGGTNYGANPPYLEWGKYPNCTGESGNYTALYVPNATDGNWHHIVFTYDESTVKAYFDGTYYASASQVGGMCKANDYVYIGYQYKGSIDEARISNVARLADWIKQSYQMVANQKSYVSFGNEESTLNVYIVTRIGLSDNSNKTNLLSQEKIATFQNNCSSDYDSVRKLIGIGAEYYFSLNLTDSNGQTLIDCNPPLAVIKPAKVAITRIIALNQTAFGELTLQLW